MDSKKRTKYWREYYAKNKTKILGRQKNIYYQGEKREDRKANARINARIKVTCECGDISNKGCIARHRKSNKHIKKMLKQKQKFPRDIYNIIADYANKKNIVAVLEKFKW